MAPQKGKQGTKGQKQIIEENIGTLAFYRNMALGANAIYIVIMFLVYDLFCTSSIVLLAMSSISYIGSYQFMTYMGKLKEEQDIYSVVDLNMEGGIAEHLKDMIILTSACQLLSLISIYFWLLMLLAPARGIYFLWVSILSPYFFQQSQVQEVDEKKLRKMEKKMMRRAH